MCDKTVGASYGDAFLAALAIGAVQRADIAAWNPIANDIKARPNKVYDDAHALFLRLYQQTKDIARALG